MRFRSSFYMLFNANLFCSISMSKRDSRIAQLPSTEDMADDMQVDARHTHGSACVSPYGPSPHPMSPFTAPNSAHPHSLSASSLAHPIPDATAPNSGPGQPIVRPWITRAQTVHTVRFQRIQSGDFPVELKIEETDETGNIRYRTLDYYFWGILNHADPNATSWHNARCLATGVAILRSTSRDRPSRHTIEDQLPHGRILDFMMGTQLTFPHLLRTPGAPCYPNFSPAHGFGVGQHSDSVLI